MSQQVMRFDISVLRPHPRNDEFFSNIEGEEFSRLKESIKELGILTPLRVAKDMTIISGHQRYRAAQELGLEDLPVIVDESLKDDDEKVVQLIAANFGRMKNDPVKQGRWIAEYERLRGVRHGGSRRNNFALISQDDIAAELGVDSRTLQNLKKLNTLLPELQDIISEGRISATTGFKLIARLSESEQHELLASLPEAQKFTQSQVQSYVDQIRGLEAQNASLSAEKEAAKEEAEKWKDDAVAATKAVRESGDSERYLSMKNKLSEANDRYRKEHEDFVAYRKEMAKQSLEWERKLNAAKAQADRTPSTVEVEVYPDDYEELKQYKQKYEELTDRMMDSESVMDFTAGMNGLESFQLRFENYVCGFVSEILGLRNEKHQLSKMPIPVQCQFADALKEIVNVSLEMLEELKRTNKEVA